MRRVLLIPILAFGTIAGFAHGFHALRHPGEYGCHRWHDAEAIERAELTPPPPAPVIVNAPAPAPVVAPAPAPAQVLVIPIIVGAQPQSAPTSYVIPVTTTAQLPAISPQAPATNPAPAAVPTPASK